MTQFLVAFGAILGIATLFWLDRDNAHVSNALWIPFFWLLIASSRPVSSWLTFSSPGGYGYTTDSYVDGSPLDRNILTFLLALAVYTLSKRMPQVRAILRANPAIIVFFIYCGLSILWADFPFVAFKRWIRSVGDVAMVLVIITERDWTSALKRILTRIGFIVIPLSILFIRFFPALGRAYSRGGAPMWTGVGTDKNALGMICMLFGIPLLWRGLSVYSAGGGKYRTRQLTSISILFLMVIYLLLVANSQTALSCFLMASVLIILTAFHPMFRKPGMATVLVLGMVTVSFCVLFLGIGGGALSTLGRDASLTGRTDVWQTVLPYAVNPWIGAGYENFWIGERLVLFTRLLGGLNQAHNGYIEVYLNIGWIGLILLVAVIASGFRQIIAGLRRRPEMNRLKLAFFFICLVYNFTEASFKMMSPVWIMFIWAIMAEPKSSRRTSESQSSSVATRSHYARLMEESTVWFS